MAAFLGAAAGGGMLILVGILAGLFLRQIGVLSAAGAGRLLRTAAVTLVFFCLHVGAAALIRRVAISGQMDSVADLKAIFAGPGLQNIFSWLEDPSDAPFLAKLYLYPAHGLGRMLFGQYLPGGVLLSLTLTGCALHGIAARVRRAWGDPWARDVQTLLLCLPGSVFLLLPGWPSLAFLFAACLFYFFGKFIPHREGRPMNRVLFDWITALLLLLSCAVTAGVVYGRIG